MDRYELRRIDYSLTEDHQALQAAYRDFFKTHCPIETVRAAEESGFDKSLWERLCAMGATTMALPDTVGGDGATLVDLTLVAEEIGRSLAPVPWIDHICTARLLARLGAAESDVVNGKQLVAFDPQHDSVHGVRLIPTGSIADQIVVRDGEDVVRLTFDTRPTKVDNIGRLPMAWVDPASAGTSVVLASGAGALAEYQRALDEWRVLTASALTGLVEETMTIAAEFAKTRYTLGVPISTLQGISHPLANIAITVQGGRNLARRAAWFLDNEPDERPELAPSAFVFMADEASKAATMAVHVQGGLGVSAEAAATGGHDFQDFSRIRVLFPPRHPHRQTRAALEAQRHQLGACRKAAPNCAIAASFEAHREGVELTARQAIDDGSPCPYSEGDTGRSDNFQPYTYPLSQEDFRNEQSLTAQQNNTPVFAVVFGNQRHFLLQTGFGQRLPVRGAAGRCCLQRLVAGPPKR